MSNQNLFLPIRLRELRKGKSQAETARLCDIPQQNYNRYEAGIVKPKHDALLKIATHYGLTVEELMDGSKEAVSKERNAEPPSTPERVQYYIDATEKRVMHHVEELQKDNAALRKRVEMLEEAFKLMPKGGKQ